MRALVVEDDPASSRAMVRLLRESGFEADSVCTLEGARAFVEHFPPRLLILDLLLPDGNGIDLLEQIRLRELPITVAVVSGAGNDVLADAIIRHPEGLFDKPLDVEGFRAWVAQLMRRWEEAADVKT